MTDLTTISNFYDLARANGYTVNDPFENEGPFQFEAQFNLVNLKLSTFIINMDDFGIVDFFIGQSVVREDGFDLLREDYKGDLSLGTPEEMDKFLLKYLKWC